MAAFSDYKNLGSVLKTFSLRYEEQPFVFKEQFDVPEGLKTEITFNLTEMPYDSSEASICESILFPILRAAWIPYKEDFTLWSHQAISYSDLINGAPDYLFAKRSALGKIVMDAPYVAVVEAKKDDFTSGWGQCAAEMYAIQQLNKTPDDQLFGIVSNGDFWEFASLQNNLFIKYKQVYKIDELNDIYSFVLNMLTIAKEQLSRHQ
jgi:hypothetical protein